MVAVYSGGWPFGRRAACTCVSVCLSKLDIALKTRYDPCFRHPGSRNPADPGTTADTRSRAGAWGGAPARTPTRSSTLPHLRLPSGCANLQRCFITSSEIYSEALLPSSQVTNTRRKLSSTTHGVTRISFNAEKQPELYCCHCRGCDHAPRLHSLWTSATCVTDMAASRGWVWRFAARVCTSSAVRTCRGRKDCLGHGGVS